MTMATFKHFDKLTFVDEAKKIGADDKFARLIASKLEEVEVHKNQDLATKSDLKDLELRLIKWQLAIGITTVTSPLASIFTLIKLFHL